MLVAGILLLIVGAVVASISRDRTVRLFGLIAAGLGLLLILLAVLGGVGEGDGLEVGAASLLSLVT